MAVVELSGSREMHITKDGSAMTRIYTCSPNDWNNGGDNYITLPIIGDYWDYDRSDLRVTDMRVYWPTNTQARVEATYSTGGTFHREKLADKVSSIKHTFDFSLEAVDGTTFVDTSGEEKNWPELWAAAHADYTVENAPPLIYYRPHLVLTERFNISGWDFNVAKDLMGAVNNADFLKQFKDKYPNQYRDIYYDVTGDDTGNWLMAGFHVEDTGDFNSEIILTYVYDWDGWNTPFSSQLAKKGVSAIETNMYWKEDFDTRPYPENTDDDIDDGLRNV